MVQQTGDMKFDADKEEVGFFNLNMTPDSEAWTELENYISGIGGFAVNGEHSSMPRRVYEHAKATINAAEEDSTFSKLMDSRILAMMELAESLVISEGDLFQTIVAPMSVGLTDIQIRHTDSGIKKSYEQLFEHLQLQQALEEFWLGIGTYGQIYPLTFWDSRNRLEGFSQLNPKHVVIEPMTVTGTRPVYYAPSDKGVVSALSRDKMFVQSVMPGWNEHGDVGKGFKLKPENVMHIHELKRANEVYCIPPLARAARSISTRIMAEEMVRATLEGLKNQILLYKLENPRPGEAAALNSKLSSYRAVRVGHLVWGANLSIEHITPQSVDRLLAPETWMRLTLDIFRKLGIHLRAVSGEISNVGQARDFEIDVQFFVERLHSTRRKFVFWMQQLANRYALSNKKIKEPPIVTLRPIDLSVQNAIKNKVSPLLERGMISYHTAMEEAGLVPDVEFELRKKEEEEGYSEYMRALPSYSQETVSPSRTVTNSPTPGRPGDSGDDSGQ